MPKKNGWKSGCRDCKWVFQLEDNHARNSAEALGHARRTSHTVILLQYRNHLENIYTVTPVKIEDAE